MGTWYLYEDFRVGCPRKEPGSLLFVWAVITTLLYPLGIPILVWLALKMFNVPTMAREKQNRAVLNRMVWLHKLHADDSLPAQVSPLPAAICAIFYWQIAFLVFFVVIW